MLPIYYPPGFDPMSFPPVDPAPIYALGEFLWSGVTYLYLSIFGG